MGETMDILTSLGLDGSILSKPNEEIVKQLRKIQGGSTDTQLLFEIIIKLIKVVSSLQGERENNRHDQSDHKHIESGDVSMESDIDLNEDSSMLENESAIYQLSDDERDAQQSYSYLESTPSITHPVPFNFTSNYKPKSSSTVKIPAKVSVGEKSTRTVTIKNWNDLSISKIAMLYNVSKGVVGHTVQLLRDFEKQDKTPRRSSNSSSSSSSSSRTNYGGKIVKKSTRKLARVIHVTPPFTTIKVNKNHHHNGNLKTAITKTKTKTKTSLKVKSRITLTPTSSAISTLSSSSSSGGGDIFKSVHNISMRNMLIHEIPSKPIDFSYDLTEDDMYKCQCGELFSKYLDLYKHKINRLCK